MLLAFVRILYIFLSKLVRDSCASPSSSPLSAAMARSAAPRKAALRLAVAEDAYSLIVDSPDEALRLVGDFFARVGVIKKRGERSVKALLQHPDGYECIASSSASAQVTVSCSL